MIMIINKFRTIKKSTVTVTPDSLNCHPSPIVKILIRSF